MGTRGPRDLFLAGSVALPCGPLKFLTDELAELDARSTVEFPGDGVLIGSQECPTSCGLSNFPIAVNLILRNHNAVNLIDLLGGFFSGLAKADPRGAEAGETAEGLSRSYGPEPAEPDDPRAEAEGFPATTVGEGTAETLLSLPGGYLTFEMTVNATGECEQASPDTVRSSVVAGTSGVARLTARATPANYVVVITAVSLPYWASLGPASGIGAVQTECTFTPPAEAVGTRFALVFRAMVPDLDLYRDLTLLLEVIAPDSVDY